MMVSIIVPVFNAAFYLERMIQSIIAQTSGDWELILVDDGSTDNSFQICKQYEAVDGRIKLIHQNNTGVSEARNTGLRAASGQYIAFCDADDFYEPDYLSTFEYFKEKEDSDLYIFGIYVDYPEKSSAVHNPPIECGDRIHGIDEAIYSWFDIYWMGLWNKVYKKRIIDDNGIEFKKDVQYDEDSIFNLSYLHACCNVFCSEKPVYHYVQQNTASLTRSFSPHRLASIKYVIERLIELAAAVGADGHRIMSMAYSRKIQTAYAQLCLLMDTNMDWRSKKQCVEILKAELENIKAHKIISNGWRALIIFFPYWMICCFFWLKKIRMSAKR